MRLINTSTLCLTSFMGSNIPKYAILSHTWEHDCEISFQEMMAISEDSSHPAAKKSGYEKVAKTCEKARNNSLAYAWVDTCCIDKTNSSELSEAINTMYRWYQQAAVCYVYLSDLDTATSSFQAALPGCKWFTRGWCLQELIAPKIVEFFDAQWYYIGSRTDLTALISKRTRIDEEVLVDSSLTGSIPVARRMSWAADRETTREEDMAYCLLGIFDINMPMLYGEGPKAFARLQEHIISRSTDLSIFAFQHTFLLPDSDHIKCPTKPYCDLFAASQREFGGCEDLKFSRTDVHSNDPFVLTNKGLYFRRAVLHIDFRNGLYSMLLNSESQNFDCSRMYLQKVGPSLYARRDACYPPADAGEECHIRTEEEVYIINRITPSVLLDFARMGEYSIHVRSSNYDLSQALQVLRNSPWSNFWDASRMQFLTRGENAFRGYWKLFPSLAQRIGKVEDHPASPPGHVYLACGLDYDDHTSPPRAWVRLYSMEIWRGLEQKLGIMTGLNDVSGLINTDHTSDHITLSTMTIAAHIELEFNNYVPRLELNLDLNARSLP